MSTVLAKRRVLVTGGAGFVGANLVRSLLTQEYQVTVLDNLSTGRRAYLSGLPIALIEGDIRDLVIAKRAVRDNDYVVHLAAQTAVPNSLTDPFHDCKVNVLGVLNLLEASRLAGVSRFVFASSNAPLGRQAPPAKEDLAPLPISPYGASKLAGEGYCLAYHGSWGLNTVVLRFANLYGPYSAHTKSVVASFMQKVANDEQLTIYGDGKQTRDFIYVSDLCHAVQLALDADVGGEIFQIASGIETSVLELAHLIEEIVEHKVDIEHKPTRLGDIRYNYSNIGKAAAQLGWQPSVTLREGLENTWNWLR